MPIDSSTNRNLPAGRPLAKVLRRVWARQEHDVVRSIVQHRPINLHKWTETLADLARPTVLHYTGDGGRDAMARIRQAVRSGQRRKAASPSPAAHGMNVGDFDLFNPRIMDAINQAVLQFAASTNATSQLAADAAREAFRDMLRTGLSQGDAIGKLQRDVRAIFQDRMRADRIARTEAMRAVHAGQVMAAEESGIVKGLEWLTSSAPCERCRELNGKQVKIGEPFDVDPKGGPYAVTLHPPLHPHCRCTILEVVDFDKVKIAA